MTTKRETLSIELPNPIYSASATLDATKKKVLELFDAIYRNFQTNVTGTSSKAKNILGKIPNFKFKLPSNFKFNKNNLLKFGAPVIIIFLVILGVSQLFVAKPSIQGAVETAVSKDAIARQDINREFNFPLRDEKGKEVATFKYKIETAELRKQIIVKGQPASAVPGRVFLILNLKLDNSLNQGLNINTRDYIRVSVNGNNEELLAPDIHNDPVEVQAISIKNTRVALAINENDKNIEIRVGEIDGEKETIKLDLK